LTSYFKKGERKMEERVDDLENMREKGENKFNKGKEELKDKLREGKEELKDRYNSD